MSVVTRLRTDLRVVEDDLDSRDRARRQRVVFDPIAGNYVRVDEEQWRHLSDRPDACEPHYLSSAAAAGLLRNRRHLPRSRWNASRLLMVRLPGFAAAPIAARLARVTDVLFSPLAVLCWLMVIAVAGLAIPIYWQRFEANLPGLRHFFSADNAVLLVATLIITKLIHELAHATVCFRMGARPGEIGVLLLCGAPCPYCDVTDSWRLSSTARRVWIMLAGIYVECILAAIALLVWWWTAPGTLHYAAMNVMIVCGVSTLLFNLNPLMRYDGYYVLSDLWGSVNLRQEAAAAFSAVVIRPFAGPSYRSETKPTRRNAWLAIYHGASVVYRTLIVVAIAGWIVGLCSAVALRPAGIVLASLMVFAIPLNGVRRLLALARGRGEWRGVAWLRRWTIAGLIAASIAGAAWVPLPQGIHSVGTIDVADAVPVYLPDAGRVAEVWADYGDKVSQGQPLLQLKNVDLRLQVTELMGNRDKFQTQSDQMRRRAIDQTDLLAQWDSQQATLQSLTARLQRMHRRIAALEIVAPISGTVLPPVSASLDASPIHAVAEGQRPTLVRPMRDAAAAERLTRSLHWGRDGWGQADGCWCRIGDPQSLEVILEIDASERSHVQVGDAVRVRCEQSPEHVVDLQIDSISTISASGRHVSDHVADVTSSRFRVACRVPATENVQWQIGAAVSARLQGPRQSLAARTTRWVKEFLRAG